MSETDLSDKQPANMPKRPRAVRAAKAEAQHGKITVKYGGHTYHVPGNRDDYNIEFLEALSGDIVNEAEALKAVLGADQYAAWRARHSKIKELSGMFDAIREAGLGNS